MSEASFYTTQSKPKEKLPLTVDSLLIEDTDIDNETRIEKKKKRTNETQPS